MSGTTGDPDPERSQASPDGEPDGEQDAGTARRPHRTAVLPSAAGRRTPRRRLVAAAAVLLVAAAGVTLLLRDREPAADDARTAPPVTQDTLLAVVTGEDGEAAAGALLGSGPDRSAGLLVPGRLLLDAAGAGRVAFAQTPGLGAQVPAAALGDALGVRVDGSWLLNQGALARLVDAVGGVVVDVDLEVRRDGEVLLRPGPQQRLDGAQAAVLAAALAPGESEATRLARTDRVLTAVLEALPQQPDRVAEVLAGLGSGSVTTIPVEAVAEVLARTARHAGAGQWAATSLPVTELATGGEPRYGLDEAAAAQVLRERFPAAVAAQGDEQVRVVVLNGVGTPGLGALARDLLADAGLRYLGGGNAEQLGRQRSVVAVPSDSPQDRARGARVAAALGLPVDAVAVGQDAPTLADVVVVLGADFAAATGGAGTATPGG